ncbi:hypothetical protein [Paraliomyxa miuraensis]|uniref:hypothetical protein n=1 Tax=Paraliomyxa miuraensis TaxID=376150 RepID=UPI00225ABFEE|nr:hypothetical protein [Paraliomyxa miuraensis]MCX4239174.1 hypothetical protein [Paraliomyxa miuraensis]
MYQVSLRLAEIPSQSVLEGMLDVLAEHNCRWYLRQWAAHREPPSSAAAAGVRWHPDAPAVEAVFQDAPLVFARKWASCGPIAAVSVGHARALDQLRGVVAARTRDEHRVVLLSQDALGRGRQWHAYHLAGHRLIDPTERMRRV